MLTLNEEKWLDIKHGMLESVDYELEEEDLYHFDDRTNSEVQNGHREIYYFEKAGMELKLQLDVIPRDEGDPIYKMRMFAQNEHGEWVDSSALDSLA